MVTIFTYLTVSLRRRWIIYLLIAVILVILGLGYSGSQVIREGIVMHAQKDLEEHWRWQYDILVYPKESQEYQGLGDGWVAPQTSISSYGGISIEELELIRQIPGVEVAAPLSLIGYFAYDNIQASFDQVEEGNVYKLDHVMNTFDGLNTIPIINKSVYRIYDAPKIGGSFTEDLIVDDGVSVFKGSVPPGDTIRYPNEMLLVAIDPEAEEQIYNISNAVVEGEDLAFAQVEIENTTRNPIIPIIALKDQGYQAEEIITISRVEIPNGSPSIELSEGLKAYFSSLSHIPIAQLSVNPYSPDMRYKNANLLFNQHEVTEEAYVLKFSRRELTRYSPIQFNLLDHESNQIPLLQAEGSKQENFLYWLGIDVLYNSYREEIDKNMDHNFSVKVIGYYDTSLITPQYASAWKQGEPIDLYTPQHSMILADGVGNTVEPTPLIPLPMKNTYYTGAPDALTTLDAAKIFYGNDPPLSSIRVVVEGVEERSEASQKKIEQVAMQIMEQTGHQVEIMLGSSAGKVHIQLGGAGEGEVGLVEEGWQQKGVSWSIEEQISVANKWLFLYLVVIIFVLSYTVITHSLLKRSTEFSMLRAIGWSRSQIILVLLAEIALLALIPLIPTLFIMQQWNEGFHWGQASILLGINLLIIAIGYYSGSRKALSHAPRAGLAGEGGTSGTKRLFPISGLWGYVLHQLLRRPLRFGLMMLSLVLSTMMVLLFVATQQSLSDYLFLSVLGEIVDLNLQPYQLMFLGLGIVFTVTVVIMLLFLNLIERGKEFYMMRSIGWSNQKITSYLLLETGVIGLLGGVIGTLLGYGLLTYFSSLWLPSWITGIAIVAPFILLLVFTWILYRFIGASRIKPKLDS